MYKSLFSTGSLLFELLNGLPVPSRPTALCGFFFPTLPPPTPPPGLCLTTLSAVDDEGQSCTHPAPRASLEIRGRPGRPQRFSRRASPHHQPCVLASLLATGVEHVVAPLQLDGSMAGFASCSWPIWHVDDFTLCFQRESVPLRHTPSHVYV